MGLGDETSMYHTAGYCCEVQIFATLLKWPLAEISAIAKFARHEADFHWILCRENAWAKFYSTHCTVCIFVLVSYGQTTIFSFSLGREKVRSGPVQIPVLVLTYVIIHLVIIALSQLWI